MYGTYKIENVIFLGHLFFLNKKIDIVDFCGVKFLFRKIMCQIKHNFYKMYSNTVCNTPEYLILFQSIKIKAQSF